MRTHSNARKRLGGPGGHDGVCRNHQVPPGRRTPLVGLSVRQTSSAALLAGPLAVPLLHSLSLPKSAAASAAAAIEGVLMNASAMVSARPGGRNANPFPVGSPPPSGYVEWHQWGRLSIASACVRSSARLAGYGAFRKSAARMRPRRDAAAHRPTAAPDRWRLGTMAMGSTARLRGALPYAIERWYNRSHQVQVVSSIENVQPEGGAEPRHEYHLSVSGLKNGAVRIYRVSDSRARWALRVFRFEGWFEDNHVPGGLVRNHWRPIADPLVGQVCVCVDTEPAIREMKGDYVWRGAPDTGDLQLT